MADALAMIHQPKPTISKLIAALLPSAPYEEQLEAHENLRDFLAVAYRMYLRLSEERTFPRHRDKFAEGDTVNRNTQ